MRIAVGVIGSWMTAVLLCLSALGLTPKATHGQSAPDADTTDVAMTVAIPDTVVVTASRIAEPAAQSGRRVSVWTHEEIEALPASSYDELLRTVSGVDVQSRGGFGVQSDITMRGSTFNGVLVLLDGARINDPMSGHFLADMPVPMSEIARIEVLRGPASALYGPDALGGVVQLFTHAGLHQEQGAPTGSNANAHAQAQVGRHGLYDVEGTARLARGSTFLSASFAMQGSNGQPISTPSGEPVTDSDGRVRTDFRRTAGSLAWTQRLSAGHSLFTRAGIDDRRFTAYQFYTSLPSDNARESTSTYWAQTRYQGRLSASTQLRAQVAAKQHEDSYRFTPSTPPNEHTSRLLTAHGQIQHALSERWQLSGGVSGQARSIDSNNLGDHADEAGGAFTRLRWSPTEPLTLTGSLRLDADHAFGTELTPQFYAAWSKPHYTLRAGAGRAVRAPNYVERYYNTELDSPPDGSVGTPNLRAERAWSYEVGADVYPTRALALHVTGFARTTNGLIDFAQSPGEELFRSRNVLSVDTYGLEAETRWQQSWGARGHAAWTLAYTGLDASLGDAGEGVLYTYAASAARHHVQGTARVQWGAVGGSLQTQWKERLDAPAPADLSYSVTNARLFYTINALDSEATVSFEMRNIFNREYSEVFNAPMPERWWLLGLSVDL